MKKLSKEEEEKKITVTLKIEQKYVAKLDKYQKKLRLKTRTQIVNKLVESGLDDLDLVNSTGFLTLAVKGFDIFEIIKDGMRHKKINIQDNRIVIDL